jgi:hypothetical protein
MPFDRCHRFDEHQGVEDPRPRSVQAHPQQSVGGMERKAARALPPPERTLHGGLSWWPGMTLGTQLMITLIERDALWKQSIQLTIADLGREYSSCAYLTSRSTPKGSAAQRSLFWRSGIDNF